MGEVLLLQRKNEDYISSEDIQARVAELGLHYSNEVYEDVDEITVLTVLNGAAPFARDLTECLEGLIITEDSIDVKSYDGVESTGTLSIKKAPDSVDNITGKHVLMVEDMLDTGLTLSSLTKWILRLNPASLQIVSLLEKPEGRVEGTEIDAPVTIGMRIANRFVVGYGLDYNNKFRELPFIVACQQISPEKWAPMFTEEPVAA